MRGRSTGDTDEQAGRSGLRDHRRGASRSGGYVSKVSERRLRRGAQTEDDSAASDAALDLPTGGDGGADLDAPGVFEWPHVAALDTFTGSPVDLERSSIARWALGEEIKTHRHRRLQEEFTRWVREAGILEPMVKCAELQDLRAQLLGLSDRTAVAEALYSGDSADLAKLERLFAAVEESPPSRELMRQIDTLSEEATAQLRDRVRASVRILWPSVRGVIQELTGGSGWLWLASEIYVMFFSLITGHVAGCGVLIQARTESANPAPEVAASFHSQPGEETFEQAKARWDLLKASVDAKFMRDAGPTQQRRRNPDRIIRAVRHWYRHKVLGDRIVDLARDYCRDEGHRVAPSRPHNHNATILADVELADELFRKGRFTWEDLPEEWR